MEKDFAKGVEWLTKAALQGNAPAQYNLGRMYQWGKGVEKDLQQAQVLVPKSYRQQVMKSKGSIKQNKKRLIQRRHRRPTPVHLTISQKYYRYKDIKKTNMKLYCIIALSLLLRPGNSHSTTRRINNIEFATSY